MLCLWALFVVFVSIVCRVCEHRLLLEKEGSIIKWFRIVHVEEDFWLRCNCVYEVRFMKVFVLSLCFMHVMARKLLYKAHKIHFLLCFMHVRMPWKSLSNIPEIHPFLFLRHVRIAWKLLPFLCLRYMRMAWKLLPNAREIHSLFYLRHVRIAWKILYKALEIHPNHKENHFFWNFSFKYFAVSIIIHNFALAFNKEAGWLQITPSGEMVEWSITTVLKTVVPRGTGGSNPSLSANRL